jgi:hypothetical protein
VAIGEIDPMKSAEEKLVLLSLGILAGLLLAEVVLRVLGISYPCFYRHDLSCGSMLRPGVTGYWLKEGGGYVSINSDGLRDREHAVAKPRNTLRIAVLGDSFTEAFQVNREDAFWAVMETELGRCKKVSGKNVEVINFGQSGFGTAMELLALRHRVWKYSPDIVLLAFFTGNDISDNSRMLKKMDHHPYFVYQGDTLVLDDKGVTEAYAKYAGWWDDIRTWIFNRSRVLQLLDEGSATLREWFGRTPTETAYAPDELLEPGLPEAVFRPPSDAVWTDAWRVTEGLLLKMRDEVREHGAEFLVIIFGNSVVVHPDPSIREKLEKRLRVEDLFYPDRRIKTFCEREGIPVLALTRSFQEYATRNKIFLHGFRPALGRGHWNESGHRLAGELIAQFLCNEKLLPVSQPQSRPIE